MSNAAKRVRRKRTLNLTFVNRPNPFASIEEVGDQAPQLKPPNLERCFGTAEAVPLSKCDFPVALGRGDLSETN